MKNERDDFTKKLIEDIEMRAAHICSNPGCYSLTRCPSDANHAKSIYTGKVAHITAASKNGPRYDPSLTTEQRASAENAIFLCSNCADMIDKNNGTDFPIELLKEWKAKHEAWLRSKLNKSIHSSITTIDGQHYAKGEGNVTAIHVEDPVQFKPGTKSVAEGKGNITATHIGPSKKSGG